MQQLKADINKALKRVLYLKLLDGFIKEQLCH